MSIHSINLTRIGYGKATVNIEADTREEATQAAMDRAGDHIYSEYASDYSCDDLPPIDDEARRKTSLERIASIIGLELEDTMEGHAALLKRANSIHAIMVSVADNKPLVVERCPMAKGWCIRLGNPGSSDFVDEDLALRNKPYFEEKLEDAIDLAHSWVNKHMEEGVTFAKACLGAVLDDGEYAIAVMESDTCCRFDEIPGPKPTIFIYLKHGLTDEIRQKRLNGENTPWRFSYKENAKVFRGVV